MEEKQKKSIVIKILIYAVIIIAIIILYQVYQKTNFNDFTKYETNLNTSEFIRDNDVKYDNKRSYKISSPEYNDAMFSRIFVPFISLSIMALR